MPAKVIVTVLKGQDRGKAFEFSGERSFTIGREKGCAVHLSEKTVSRNHCGMKIVPPDITFYDAGSLNGTWLNGKEIVKGRGALSREEAAKLEHKTFSLHNGDVLGIGSDVELKFAVLTPDYCADCLGEIEDDGEYLNSEGAKICAQCYEKKKVDPFATVKSDLQADQGDATVPAKPAQGGPVCTICGALLTDIKPGQARICDKCKKPDDVLDRIIRKEKEEYSGKIPPVIDLKSYRQVKELGRGGMGVVYLMENIQTGHKAALKYMLPGESVDETARKIFLRETDVGSRLDHPHVIKQYGSGSIGDSFYILMEFCAGSSVDKAMQKIGALLGQPDFLAPLPERIAVDITLQVLDGLVYTHGQTVIHRDIKPFNFFIANEFHPEKYIARGPGRGVIQFNEGAYVNDVSAHPVVKVADFGLAKAYDSGSFSRTGDFKGTLSFSPRQQIRDSKYAEKEVDVWAAAASLYFMLTGRTPKPIRNRLTMFEDLLRGQATPILQVHPGINPALAKIIDEALADNPVIKIKDAGELKERIEKTL
jgi:serine/threonine-protein kinase